MMKAISECPSWMMLSYWMNELNGLRICSCQGIPQLSRNSSAVRELGSCLETLKLCQGTLQLSWNSTAVTESFSCHGNLRLSDNSLFCERTLYLPGNSYVVSALCSWQRTLEQRSGTRKQCLVSSSSFNTSYVTRDSRPCWHCDNCPPTVEVVQYATGGT